MVLVTSGCMGILGGGTSSFAADPVTPRAVDLDRSGYEQAGQQTLNETRTLGIGGQDRDAALTSHLRMYDRSVSTDGGTVPARIAVYSTPLVELGGDTVSPIGDWSDQRLANHVSRRYADIELERIESRRNVKTLVENSPVRRHLGVATLDGQQVNVYVQVTTFQYGGNVVAAVAVRPQSVDESNRLDSVLTGLILR
jgi:hypothetical protein